MEITPKQLVLPNASLGRIWAIPGQTMRYGGLLARQASLLRARARVASRREWVQAGVVAWVGAAVFVHGLPIIPFFAALFLFGMGLGYLTLAVRSLVGEGWLTYVPAALAVSPVLGSFTSTDQLPNLLQVIVHFFPLTYAVAGLHTAVEGGFLFSAFVATLLLSGVYTYFAHLFYSALVEGREAVVA